jgi:hypothetical protein
MAGGGEFRKIEQTQECQISVSTVNRKEGLMRGKCWFKKDKEIKTDRKNI